MYEILTNVFFLLCIPRKSGYHFCSEFGRKRNGSRIFLRPLGILDIEKLKIYFVLKYSSSFNPIAYGGGDFYPTPP